MTTNPELIDQIRKQARVAELPEDVVTAMVEYFENQPPRPIPVVADPAEVVRDMRELEALMRVTNLAALTPEFIRAGVRYEEARRILQKTQGCAGMIRAHMTFRRTP